MRLIQPQEINAYVKQVRAKKNGGAVAILLLYKDARYDMSVLDEVYGPMNWKVDYKTVRMLKTVNGSEVVNDCLYCTISVYDRETNQWVDKTSNGTESNMEAQKGEASDALKRAGFLWGIGRELYSGPKIFINLKEDEYKVDSNGNCRLNSWIEFHVDDIAYENRNISYITIADSDNNIRFTWGSKGNQPSVPPEVKKKLEAALPQPIKEESNLPKCDSKTAWMNLLHHFGYSDNDRTGEASLNAIKEAKKWSVDNFGSEINPLKFASEHITKIQQFLQGPESFVSDPLP